MNTAEQLDPVIDRLGQVLDQGNLPPPYDRCGARLLSLLTRPVQVVVTGLAGSGKSRLIEMMAARPDAGPGHAVPVFELCYGETEQALIERADGSVSTVAGLLRNCDIPGDALRVRQELNDPRLIQQDFVEIGLRGTPAQQDAALEAAIGRADLVIWCSQDFSAEEQALWSRVPDPIKDHSVLALTMADQQLMRGVLNDTIARLAPVVADEFLGLFPVATIQGLTAQTGADRQNDALWASSGGKSLMDLVLRQVRQGRTADVDQARVFLDRLAQKLPQGLPTPANDAGSDAGTGADATATSRPQPPAARPQDVAQDAPQNAPQTVPEIAQDEKTVALLSEAVDVLQAHATRMLDALDDGEAPDTNQILDDCSDAIGSVSALFNAARGGGASDTIRGDLREGEEMLMLFQLERGEDAALDAVTLVLQLRKELAEKLVS